MNQNAIIHYIMLELEKAKTKFPLWPVDVIHAVSVMNEEAGESIQAALQLSYEGGSIDNVKAELIQTAAMCFRALENIDNLKVYPHKI